ncbi:MAG: methylated-DNA--[protein]-cysteine S-methyltransferase [Bifidobacteriaceae bacterium]|jgi:methylated-DNA-[protein]-cysteine S-methyltransferase|nr:methylated-DNA--[protein]-cysteine S-methyltransferase [Bifidobacteriaceae bacterium]
MIYSCQFDSPLGRLTGTAEQGAITGLWFDGQKHYPTAAESWEPNPGHLALTALGTWLEAYFDGQAPAVDLKLAFVGSDFRRRVWQALRSIPYGQTTTYGAIAKRLSTEMGGRVVAARAVGGAVGHNPISIVVPCHRVIGSTGQLTGYAGGLNRKIALLEIEGHEGLH